MKYKQLYVPRALWDEIVRTSKHMKTTQYALFLIKVGLDAENSRLSAPSEQRQPITREEKEKNDTIEKEKEFNKIYSLISDDYIYEENKLVEFKEMVVFYNRLFKDQDKPEDKIRFDALVLRASEVPDDRYMDNVANLHKKYDKCLKEEV